MIKKILMSIGALLLTAAGIVLTVLFVGKKTPVQDRIKKREDELREKIKDNDNWLNNHKPVKL